MENTNEEWISDNSSDTSNDTSKSLSNDIIYNCLDIEPRNERTIKGVIINSLILND
jgi:hypothetical protein